MTIDKNKLEALTDGRCEDTCSLAEALGIDCVDVYEDCWQCMAEIARVILGAIKEPSTCRNNAADPENYFVCSECDDCYPQEDVVGGFCYCPACGSKVMK